MKEREMKDSGIPWIGEIPNDWEKLTFKYSGSFQKGKLPININNEGIGKPIIGASEMLGKQARQYSIDEGLPECKKNDILILWDGANAGIVSNSHEGIVSSTATTYSCKDQRCYPQYVFYLFKSVEPYFRDKVFGTTIPHMNIDYINDVPLLLPSIVEQKAIAEFLDRKCGEIDELVALQDKMIEELKAYKQSIITETVTKGLYPNVSLKDSGIEWIGKIPQHWNLIKTLYILEIPITDGPHETPTLYDDGIPFISAEAVSSGKIDFSSKRGFISKDFYDYCCQKYVPRRNDIYMIKSGATTGKTAIVETDEVFTIWSPLAVFRANPSKIIPRYLLYMLRSSYFQKEVENNWSMGTQQNIGMRALEKIKSIVPPLSEQQEIADFLDKKCSEIDSLIELKQQKIEELKDYKKSIIYEYVTGKKQVEINEI